MTQKDVALHCNVNILFFLIKCHFQIIASLLLSFLNN
jgi:hypothetical protein